MGEFHPARTCFPIAVAISTDNFCPLYLTDFKDRYLHGATPAGA